jgi:hypothetical protein
MENIFERQSAEFQSWANNMDNPPIALSYTALRQLDPYYDGTPLKFCQYYLRPKSYEANKVKTFVEYMVYGKEYVEQNYVIIGDLRTKAGKEQMEAIIAYNNNPANLTKRWYIKASDLEGFDLMQQGIILNPIFRSFIEMEDTKRCFYDTAVVSIINRDGDDMPSYKYNLNMFLHLYNATENKLCIIKEGKYPTNNQYLWNNSGIQLQAAIYRQGQKLITTPDIYVCTIDKTGQHNAFLVGEDTIARGENQLYALLGRYQKHLNNGDWHQSYMANNNGEVWKI